MILSNSVWVLYYDILQGTVETSLDILKSFLGLTLLRVLMSEQAETIKSRIYTKMQIKIGRASSLFNFGVLESVHIKTKRPALCRQKSRFSHLDSSVNSIGLPIVSHKLIDLINTM